MAVVLVRRRDRRRIKGKQALIYSYNALAYLSRPRLKFAVRHNLTFVGDTRPSRTRRYPHLRVGPDRYRNTVSLGMPVQNMIMVKGTRYRTKDHKARDAIHTPGPNL